MSALIEMSVEATLLLLVALGLVVALRRRSASLRHAVLAIALVCTGLLPLAGWVAPVWSTPATARAAAVETEVTGARVVGAGGGEASSRTAPAMAAGRPLAPGAEPALRTIWLTGVAMSVLVLGVGLGRLVRITSQAVPVSDKRWTVPAAAIAREYGLPRPVALLRSGHPALLVTWGLRQPKVILPAAAIAWPADRIRIVLAHELAHVRRRDWVLQIAVQLLRAAHWFNPIVWLATSRLRQESEQACDDSVLRLGIDGSAYATHLLDLARAFSHHRRTWSPAPAIARPSSLERRVRAMLNTHANREPVTRAASIAAALVILAITVGIAGFTASAQTFSTVSGTIIDPQGALLPGVRVALTNTRTNQKYEVRTNRTGQYELVGIPDGAFALTAQLPGFQTRDETVTVAGRNVQRDLSLVLGTLQETITVTGPPTSRSNIAYDGDALRAAFREAAARCSVSGASAGPATGGNIRPPRKIRHVAPLYPEGLQAAGIGGTVKLDAMIGVDGRVRQVDAEPNQTVDSGLVAAATDAVLQWEFDGTLLNCVPVEVQMDVAVYFNPQP